MLEDLLSIGSLDRKAVDTVDALKARFFDVLRGWPDSQEREQYIEVRRGLVLPRMEPGIERC